MVTLYINNFKVVVPSQTTVLQACEKAHFSVPKFCFHERLLVAGNCRMCLVEIEKIPKPVASCAIPVSNDLRVFTDSPLVHKARESVLEFLLLNHPLDCPVCDQGGECDLQNQSFSYGSDLSRVFSFKRSVSNKPFGPLVKTVITRCIHCTRCIRFFSEVAGNGILGITQRGLFSEIGTFKRKSLSVLVSGNIIDLCPVGSISYKVYLCCLFTLLLNSC